MLENLTNRNKRSKSLTLGKKKKKSKALSCCTTAQCWLCQVDIRNTRAEGLDLRFYSLTAKNIEKGKKATALKMKE